MLKYTGGSLCDLPEAPGEQSNESLSLLILRGKNPHVDGFFAGFLLKEKVEETGKAGVLTSSPTQEGVSPCESTQCQNCWEKRTLCSQFLSLDICD